MALLRFPETMRIDFMGLRKITIAVHLSIIVLTVLGYLFQGLKYGIDFQGGLMLEVRLESPGDLQDLRTRLGQAVEGEFSIQELGTTQRDFLIRVEQKEDATPQQTKATLDRMKQALGQGVDYRKMETIGPKVGKELILAGFVAIVFALLAMLGYIWIRFEWQFSVCAILALINDCIAVVGLFTLTRLEFNETAIVAILITASYSINDTVVIFDRIRENLRKLRKMPLDELLNLSLNETLSRTLLTSGTTLVALLALYFLGGDVIASYSLPIIVGIGIGTCSSIFLAAPLLSFFTLKRTGASSPLSGKA